MASNKTLAGMSDYNTAVKLYPNEVTYATRGLVYYTMKDFQKAFSDFFTSMTLNPKYSKAYYGYGLIKLHDKQYQYALNWCRKGDSLEYNPELSELIRK